MIKTLLIGICFLLSVPLLLAMATFEANTETISSFQQGPAPCYTFERRSGRIGTTSFTMTTEADGKELTADEKACVQSAINLIGQFSDCLEAAGAGPITVDGGGTDLVKDKLQDLHDQRRICRESVARPRSAASTSRTDPDAYTNHPGINIVDKWMKCKKSDGSESKVATLALALMLIHESSHLTNSNEAANNKGEYESPAYDFAAKAYCKILEKDCLDNWATDAAELQVLQEQLCIMIKDANAELCSAGEDQIECAECGAPPINIEVIKPGPCPPDPPAQQPPGSGFAPVTWEELSAKYASGLARGHITLTPWDKEMNIYVGKDSGSTSVAIDLSSIGGEVVTPLAFDLISESSAYVAAIKDVDWSARVYRVDFDVSTPGIPNSVTTVYSGSDFLWPSSIRQVIQKPTHLIIFDQANTQVWDVNSVGGTANLLADSQLVPELINCRYAVAFKSKTTPEGGGPVLNTAIIQCSWDAYSDQPPTFVQPVVGLVDLDIDGDIDDYVLWP